MDKEYVNNKIIECYTSEEHSVLANKLGITLTNLRKKASRLGIKKGTVSNNIVNGKKLCSKCKQLLKVDKFNKDKYQPNGLDYQCRRCRKTKEEPVIKTVQKNRNKNNDMAFNKRKTLNPVIVVRGVESLRCKACNEVKPLTEYHKDKNNKSGHKNFCKACVSRKKRG